MRLPATTAVLLAACGPRDHATGLATNPPPEITCDVVELQLTPEDGATEVPRAPEIRFRATRPRPIAEEGVVHVSGPDGPVPGYVTLSGDRTLVWSPQDFLAPSTDYVASLDWTCGYDELHFTTTADRRPAVWAADLANGQWEGTTDTYRLFRALFWQSPLIELLAVGTDTVDLRFAADKYGSQNPCVATVDQLAVDYTSAPAVGFELARLPVTDSGLEFTQVSFSGELDVDRLSLSLALEGTLDLSALGTEVEYVCGVLDYGQSCEPCPRSGDLACLPLSVRDVPTIPWPGSLEPRTAAEVAADRDCPIP